MLSVVNVSLCSWGAQLATIYGFEENKNIAQIVMQTNSSVTRYWVGEYQLLFIICV